MIVNKEDIKLWLNLTFKTKKYHRNFDVFVKNENIITECEGDIMKIRVEKKKPSLQIGEYGYSVWNLELGRLLKFKLKKLLTTYSNEIEYDAFVNELKNGNIELKKYNKIIFIHRIILHPDYRKHGVTEEFMEYIYRSFYDEKTLIVTYLKPIQEDLFDDDYFINLKDIILKDDYDDPEIPILARTYYELDDFIHNNKTEDEEYSSYKLFAIASRCGFERVGESEIFVFNPQKTIKRLKYKFI